LHNFFRFCLLRPFSPRVSSLTELSLCAQLLNRSSVLPLVDDSVLARDEDEAEAEEDNADGSDTDEHDADEDGADEDGADENDADEDDADEDGADEDDADADGADADEDGANDVDTSVDSAVAASLSSEHGRDTIILGSD
jgi:hypothetical protein